MKMRWLRIGDLGRIPAWLWLAASVLASMAGSAAANDAALTRDLIVDRAMGVLAEDPMLDRILTTAPAPWPGPRGEQPFDQQPPSAQEDLRRPRAGPPPP